MEKFRVLHAIDRRTGQTGIPRNSSSPARCKISEYLSAQSCGQLRAKHGTFPSNLFPFCLFRTLFPNGRTATLLQSIRSALFLSQRRCGGYDPVETSRVSPASYQLSTVDFPAVPRATMSRFPVPHQPSWLQRRASRRRNEGYRCPSCPELTHAYGSSVVSWKFVPSVFRRSELQLRHKRRKINGASAPEARMLFGIYFWDNTLPALRFLPRVAILFQSRLPAAGRLRPR